MVEVCFSVPGAPRGKGRPRFGGGRVFTDPKTKEYEGRVSIFAKMAMNGSPPIEGPVSVEVTAQFERPKSRKAGSPMVSRPDLDNIVKTLDAVNGIVWHDDSQVVQLVARKEYAKHEGMHVVVRSE